MQKIFEKFSPLILTQIDCKNVNFLGTFSRLFKMATLEQRVGYFFAGVFLIKIQEKFTYAIRRGRIKIGVQDLLNRPL